MNRIALTLLAAAMVAPTLALAQPDAPAAAREAAAAERLAGRDLTAPLFLCHPHGNDVVRDLMTNHQEDWVPSTRVFDNLYFIGSRFVGVYILKTPGGLVMFDSGINEQVARDHIVPEMRRLGLDPNDLKFVIVTHGHWDHFGGSPYFQRRYGARIGASSADWRIMEKAPRGGSEIQNQPVPRRDLEIADGQTLTLGGTTITFFITPGHTLGTVSAMIPVRDHGRVRIMSLLGGTTVPAVRAPNNRIGGQVAAEASMRRLAGLAVRYRAEGLMNMHAFADGGIERMARLRAEGPGRPNPYVIGTAAVARYYTVLDHCMKAALARPEMDDTQLAHSFPED